MVLGFAIFNLRKGLLRVRSGRNRWSMPTRVTIVGGAGVDGTVRPVCLVMECVLFWVGARVGKYVGGVADVVHLIVCCETNGLAVRLCSCGFG